MMTFNNRQVIIMNATFGGNKGAEAMLVTMIQKLESPKSNVILLIDDSTESDVQYFRQNNREIKIRLRTFSSSPKKIIKNICIGHYDNFGNCYIPLYSYL